MPTTQSPAPLCTGYPLTRMGLRVGTLGLAVLALGCGAAAGGEKLPDLPGTNWQLLSFTDLGEPYKDAQNPADVEFLKDGTWGILHYGGFRESGKYWVKGDRLTMKTEDDEIYNDAIMTWNAKEGVLELKSDVDLMRLGPQEKH